jgi:hypothetical protein
MNFAGETIPTYEPKTEAFRASAGMNDSGIQELLSYVGVERKDERKRG